MKNDFSKQFRPMLEIALSEAQRFNSPVITSEHFVLGSMRQRDGYAFKILSQLNIPIDKIVSELEEYLSEPHQAGETTTLFEQQYKINLAAIRHLQLATSEARKMNAHVIGSEHILLALIHDKRAMDSEILQHIKEEYLNFDISVQSFGQIPGDVPQMSKDFDEDDADDDGPVPSENFGSGRQRSQKISDKSNRKSDSHRYFRDVRKTILCSSASQAWENRLLSKVLRYGLCSARCRGFSLTSALSALT